MLFDNENDRSLFFKIGPPSDYYTLSLHDALPISSPPCAGSAANSSSCATRKGLPRKNRNWKLRHARSKRSEEHTSELQSPDHLVCRLLLEKKKIKRVMNLPSAWQMMSSTSVKMKS